MKRLIFLPFIFLCGCSPSSMEEYQREGEALCRSFTQDLQKIENREDLLKALPKIKQHYEEIADLIIEAQNFKKEHSGEAIDPWNSSDMLASETLMLELKRIYRMEGGKELMENAQREALFRLDAMIKNSR
jgi:DNA gyrase/topoisomerase IV subunit A